MSLTKATYSMVNGAPANVLDFGADPTGVTNSSAAFLAALQAAPTVYVPQGTYQVSVDIPLTFTYGPVRLIGAGIFKDGHGGTRLIPPAGATSVLRFAAPGNNYLQYCEVSQLSIANPNSVASCIGIYINGTDVNSINDYHKFSDLTIGGFQYGVRVTGRMIESLWTRINVDFCNIGFYATPDPNDAAFIFNTFITCNFNDCQAEGFKLDGFSLTNKFITCNFQANNTLNVAGIAGSFFGNSQGLSLDNCYWEGNGSGVAVDTSNPANNSIACKFTGNSFTSSPVITNSWIEGSGTGVLIDSAIIAGGKLETTIVTPKTSAGYIVAVLSEVNQGVLQNQFKIANLGNNGKISILSPIGTQYNSYIEQPTGWIYETPLAVNLATGFANFMINASAGAVTFPAPTNITSGIEMSVWTFGNTTTIPASVMWNGVAVVIAVDTMKTFVGLPFPYAGKLAVKS